MKIAYILLSAAIMTAVLTVGMAALLYLSSLVMQHKHPQQAHHISQPAPTVTKQQSGSLYIASQE